MTELSKRIFTSLFLFVIFFLCFLNSFILFLVLILCFFQIFVEFYYLFKNYYLTKKKIKLFLTLFFLLIIITYLIIFIWASINSSNYINQIFLLFIITISITTDISGFIFGKIFKGKKLTKISPKKTYSGMLGSFLCSGIFVYFIFENYFYTNYLIIFIILVSAISQIGDILISYLKRKNNLKDTGKILPGHGGLLDRFDGIIFALLLGTLLKIYI